MEPKKANDPDELGGWRINGRLGEGGFGTVYLSERGAQKAALKVIRQEFISEVDARDRLAIEAEVLSKLSDPYIGAILDSDLSGDTPWIATEFVNGPTLDEKVRYEGPLDEITWFNLAANIFHAIVTAHKMGIIHKDIKPSNIILGETGTKLIDFGIAHISGQTKTLMFGDREGSTLFSSPEHFTPKSNPKMDVFSAAATLAFAGKGAGIWGGENDLQLMRSINDDEPNLSNLTENQNRFLRPLLEKNPSDRPTSLEAYQSALGYIEYLLGRSKKPTPIKRVRNVKTLLRSKSVMTGGAVSLIAVAAFAASNQNQSSQNNFSQPQFTISPSSSPTPTPESSATPEITPSKPSKKLTEEEIRAAAECVRLTNELKTNEAIIACEVAANAGDAASMNSLGYNYYVTLNKQTEGIAWYKKAAKAGSAVAMYNLGTLYLEKNNSVEAEKWFLQCMNSDYAVCAFNYGSLLQKSGRVSEAKNAYQKGVKLGDSGSAQNLGLIYVDEQNWVKARDVLLVGAKLDNHLSAYSLGQVYLRNFSDIENACTWFYKSLSLKKDYENARRAVIEICKNRSFTIAPDVQISTGPAAPYQANTSGSDRKVGDWVLWLKNSEVDASKATGIQFKVSGANVGWQYVFYGTYSNSAGVYSYISERQGLEGACLDFRLVRESKDGYIVQIWNMPKSICNSN